MPDHHPQSLIFSSEISSIFMVLGSTIQHKSIGSILEVVRVIAWLNNILVCLSVSHRSQVMNKIYKLEIDVEIKLLFYTICLVLIIGYGFME